MEDIIIKHSQGKYLLSEIERDLTYHELTPSSNTIQALIDKIKEQDRIIKKLKGYVNDLPDRDFVDPQI